MTLPCFACRLAATAAFFGAFGAMPAAAQSTDYEAIVRTMRNCATIPDINSRVACYDRTVNADAPASQPERAAAPQPAPAAVPQPQPQAAAVQPTGFGSEDLPRRDVPGQEREEELAAVVVSAVQREPGIYLLTLEDDSQWQMVDPAPPSYDPPRKGSNIVIARGSLGSFFLNYSKQRALRVKRVR